MTNALKQHVQNPHLSGLLNSQELRLQEAESNRLPRTEGPKGAELFAQAVIAYRSALEVYSAEAFPLQHEQTEKQLKECESLLMQAKLKLNKVKRRSQ